MRKYFVTGFYLIIIGLLLLGGGFAMGAEKTVLWDHGFKISKRVDKTESVDKFDSIKIDSNTYTVNIETGDRYKVHVVGDGLRDSKYYVSDGTLHISNPNYDKYSDIVGSANNPSITVTVPAGATIDNLDMYMNRLGANFDGLKINHLRLANGADGSILFRNCEIKNAKVNQIDSSYIEFQQSEISNLDLKDSDDMNFSFVESTIKNSTVDAINMEMYFEKGVIENLNMKTKIGHSEINNSTLRGKNFFDIKNGSFSTKSVDTEGLDLSTVNGQVTYYGQSEGKNYQNDPDAENLLKVQTTNGSIDVGSNE